MIEVQRDIKKVTINVTRDEKVIKIQPIISTNTAFDGIVDGGTP